LKDIYSAKTIENYIKKNFETKTIQQGFHKTTYIFLEELQFLRQLGV